MTLLCYAPFPLLNPFWPDGDIILVQRDRVEDFYCDLLWTVCANKKLVHDLLPGPHMVHISSNNILCFFFFCFFNKNKNQTTPRCSFFKWIAPSVADIFSNTKSVKKLVTLVTSIVYFDMQRCQITTRRSLFVQNVSIFLTECMAVPGNML